MKLYIYSLIVIVAVLFGMNGCNEVDDAIDQLTGKSSSTASSAEAVDMASLFPVIDEKKMVEDPPQDTVETTASAGKVETTPQDGSVQISKSLVHGSSADGKKVTVDSAAVSAADAQKPLFVDGEFQGIIFSVSDRGDGSSDVALRNARYVTEAYKHFDLEFKNSDFRLLPYLKEYGFDKELGYGVIDVHSTQVETVDEILESIEKLMKLGILPPEKVYIDPDCGLKRLPREIAKAKLKNMVEAARIARTQW